MARKAQTPTTQRHRKNEVHAVILIHGIRTYAFWHEVAKEELEKIPGIVAESASYGRFGLPRFLIPGPIRYKPAGRIGKFIRQTKSDLEQDYDTVKLSVIAHSFGSKVVTDIMETAGDIKLEYLVFCGAVIPESYDFVNIKLKVKKGIVNYVACKDKWPAVAKIATVGYGPSGTLGMTSAGVENRKFHFDHSDFFARKFIKDHWIPIFRSGQIMESGFQPTKSDVPLGIRFMAALFPGIVPACLLLVCLAFVTPQITSSASRGLNSFLDSMQNKRDNRNLRIETIDPEIAGILSTYTLDMIVQHDRSKEKHLSSPDFYSESKNWYNLLKYLLEKSHQCSSCLYDKKSVHKYISEWKIKNISINNLDADTKETFFMEMLYRVRGNELILRRGIGFALARQLVKARSREWAGRSSRQPN